MLLPRFLGAFDLAKVWISSLTKKAKFKPVARKIQFGLIGDQQHTALQEKKFEAVIDHMNAAKIGFVVYGGDIIGSNRPCDDVTSARRLVTFNRSRLPFILTPGDNDWTDRGRATRGLSIRWSGLHD